MLPTLESSFWLNKALLMALACALPAFGDLAGQVTVPIGGTMDLNSGTVGSTGGDFRWDGSVMTPQGGAVYFFVSALPPNDCTSFTLDSLTPILAFANSAPFTWDGLPGQTALCFVYKTRTGNSSAVSLSIATATAGRPNQPVTVKFNTYGTTSGGGGGGGTGGGGGAGAPSISTVQNNYGNIRPGLPNYGIAPGAIFYIQGSNLSSATTDLLSSASPGLTTTRSGVTVSVTAGGQTNPCPLYYLSPTQINAILPSNTALGNATITVNNNGQSGTFAITVVQSAFGILSYNGSLGAVYDAGNAILTTGNSANPNQAVVLWGSGVGTDPQADDKLFPQRQNNLTNIPMQVFVGGISATIAYRGRSQFPGVDQVVITIPGNVPVGCYVSLLVVSGNIVSNSVTIPIAANGRACSDNGGNVLPPSVVSSLAGKTTVRQGAVILSQSTLVAPGLGIQNSNSAFAAFQSVGGFASSQASSQVSIGSCLVTVSVSGGATGTVTGLDAGASILATGPGGSVTLTKLTIPGAPSGLYSPPGGTVSASFLPAAGGNFTFTGTGGADVGAFTAQLTAPTALNWTNEPQITGVNRAQGVTVNWSGGQNGSYVTISGSSTSGTTSVSFTCIAPVSAGTFTVPAGILLALPAGNNGSLAVNTSSNPSIFNASGIDLGIALATSGTTKTLAYN